MVFNMAYPQVLMDYAYPLLRKSMSLICLLLLTLHTVTAAIFTVTNNNDSGAGSFRQAISAANSSPGADTIVFGSVTGTIDINTPITVNDDLTITGPGVDVLTLNSTVTTNFDALFLQSVGNSNTTLLISDLTFQQDPLSTKRLIRAKNEGKITLRNARLLGNGNAIPGSSGGAIYAEDTEVLIQNSVIDNFNTEFRGGAVFMHSLGTGATADLVVEDSLFSNNVTSGSSSSFNKHGGAIATERSNNVSAKITVRNSSFTSNSSLPASFAHGGAIYGEDDITIDHGYFFQNVSNDSGGAIYSAQSGGAKVTIRNSLFAENMTTGSGFGGALYVFNNNLDIENSTFNSNTSASRGGAVHHQISGIINIVNSTFSANVAGNVGGALDSDPTAPAATRINMLNVTMVGNSASAGGSIYNDLDFNTITIVNSIVASNSATTSGTEISGAANIDFSLIGDNPGDADQAQLTKLTPGNNIFDMDPQIDVLADNGGQAAGRNGAVVIPTHAVLENSVLIGAGDASATNSSITLPANDQRGTGFERIKDGGIEIGALEFDASVITGGSIVPTGSGGGGSLTWWLMMLILVIALGLRFIQWRRMSG